MRVKLCLFVLLMAILSQSAYSSGALRFILPYLSSITSGLREGEIAYDEIKKEVVFKNNLSTKRLSEVFDEKKTPRILTAVTGEPTGENIVRSNISAGNIKINGSVYRNSSSKTCLYSELSPTISLGFFDGSTKPTTPSGLLQNPMYLYFVSSSSGEFDCVLSFKENGPVAGVVSGKQWSRVQTIVGGRFGPLGGIYRTMDSRTLLRNPSSAFTTLDVSIGDNVTYSDPLLFTNSMESIIFKSISCRDGGGYIMFFEKFIAPTETYFAEVPACGSFGLDSSTGEIEYFFTNGERKVYITASEAFYLPIVGWREMALTSN